MVVLEKYFYGDVRLVTKEYMKKYIINEKEYFSKRMMEIGVFYKKCAFKKHKEMVVYENGIMVVRMKAGVCQYYSTEDVKNSIRFLFYDMNGEGDEIFFEDKNIQKEWRTILVYMFSEEGAFLLYVDRSTLSVTGVRARVGNEASILAIRQEAYNAAALLLEELPDRLLVMEEAAKKRESELTLLSVEAEYGK